MFTALCKMTTLILLDDKATVLLLVYSLFADVVYRHANHLLNCLKC